MRLPYQTLTILYRKDNNKILYSIFYRNSHPIWQFISGGGEDNETPIETVIREIKEETSLVVEKTKIKQLDSKTTIPVLNITGKYTWGNDVYVIPEYSFAVEIGNSDIRLSNEHKEYKWVEQHAWEYGYVIRYPSGKSDITGIISEPWHLRYVGIPAAKLMWEQGLCLEEFLGVAYDGQRDGISYGAGWANTGR